MSYEQPTLQKNFRKKFPSLIPCQAKVLIDFRRKIGGGRKEMI